MTTTIVKDATALVSALKVAHAGDVIQLASGSYEAISLKGIKFDGTVTITSEDPSKMATLNGLKVSDCQGLSFQNLEMVVDASKPDYTYLVYGSKNIQLDGLNVHGSMDGNAQNDAAAMMIRNSDNVTLTNSEFQQLRHGVQHLDSSNLKIADNSFHDIQTDGIRGGGSSHVQVTGNYFTNFHAAEGDHPDAIQFWTTNTTTSAMDITVSGNIVVRGGGDPIQGIFFRDQVGNLPYLDVKVIDNLVVGGMYNGIAVGGTNGLTITGNTVVGLADQQSWIRVNADNVTLENNTATQYLLDGSTNVREVNDKTVDTPTDGGMAVQREWLASHSTTGSTTLKSALPAPMVGAASVTASMFDAAATAAMREMDLTRSEVVTVKGTAGADGLKVDAAHDTYVDGGDGNDNIYGGGFGHNTLAGGAGNDTYYVKSSHDQVVENAGGGDDQVVSTVDFVLSDNVENLRLLGDAEIGVGNALNNKIVGTDGANELSGMAGDDLIYGQGGDDRIYGGQGNDVLNGNDGNDTLSGDDGADKLCGHSGNDSLAGGGGNDTLEGGVGADTFSGGAGADTFMFRNGDLSMTGDRILDFKSAEGDKINLRGIDANTNISGDQNFVFIGTSAFHKVAGELRFEVANGVSTVSADVNGDGVADFQLILPGVGTLQSADFFL